MRRTWRPVSLRLSPGPAWCQRAGRQCAFHQVRVPGRLRRSCLRAKRQSRASARVARDRAGAPPSAPRPHGAAGHLRPKQYSSATSRLCRRFGRFALPSSVGGRHARPHREVQGFRTRETQKSLPHRGATRRAREVLQSDEVWARTHDVSVRGPARHRAIARRVFLLRVAGPASRRSSARAARERSRRACTRPTARPPSSLQPRCRIRHRAANRQRRACRLH